MKKCRDTPKKRKKKIVISRYGFRNPSFVLSLVHLISFVRSFIVWFRDKRKLKKRNVWDGKKTEKLLQQLIIRPSCFFPLLHRLIRLRITLWWCERVHCTSNVWESTKWSTNSLYAFILFYYWIVNVTDNVRWVTATASTTITTHNAQLTQYCCAAIFVPLLYSFRW